MPGIAKGKVSSFSEKESRRREKVKAVSAFAAGVLAAHGLIWGVVYSATLHKPEAGQQDGNQEPGLKAKGRGDMVLTFFAGEVYALILSAMLAINGFKLSEEHPASGLEPVFNLSYGFHCKPTWACSSPRHPYSSVSCMRRYLP